MITVFNNDFIDPRSQPIFLGQPLGLQRFDLLKYPKFFKLAETQEGFFWRANEVDLTKDRSDYKSLSETDRFIFDSNLRWQTMTDSMLSRSINGIMEYITNPELEACCQVWAFFESNIHSRSYSHILKSVYPDETAFWNSIIEDKEIIRRASEIKKSYDNLFGLDYYATQTDIKRSIFNALVSTNVTEALAFYVSFACSFFFGATGVMEGNAKIIKFIERDERCVSDDTEVFTSDGWKLIQNLTQYDHVAQVNKDNTLTFVKPSNIINKSYKGIMKRLYMTSGLDMLLTPDHRVVWQDKQGNWGENEAQLIKFTPHKYLPACAKIKNTTSEKFNLTDYQRFLIALQADGRLLKHDLRNGKFSGCKPVVFKLKKDRKLKELKLLLSSLKFDYTESKINSQGMISFYIKVPKESLLTKSFSDWVKGSDFSVEWCKDFIEELVKWDGSLINSNRYYYSSIKKDNVEIAQTIAMLAGYKTHFSIQKDNRKETYNTVYRLSIRKNVDSYNFQSIKSEDINYDGNVTCVTVPSGMFLAKRNNNIFVTGNCHANITTEILKILRDVPEEGFQEIYNPDLIIEAYKVGLESEKMWADYLFSKGSPLGLTAEQFKMFAEFKANERLRLLDLPLIAPKQKDNPLGSWYNEFLNSDKVQVAPQETEITSYRIGARDTTMDQQEIKDLDF